VTAEQGVVRRRDGTIAARPPHCSTVRRVADSGAALGDILARQASVRAATRARRIGASASEPVRTWSCSRRLEVTSTPRRPIGEVTDFNFAEMERPLRHRDRLLACRGRDGRSTALRTPQVAGCRENRQQSKAAVTTKETHEMTTSVIGARLRDVLPESRIDTTAITLTSMPATWLLRVPSQAVVRVTNEHEVCALSQSRARCDCRHLPGRRYEPRRPNGRRGDHRGRQPRVHRIEVLDEGRGQSRARPDR